MDENTKSYNLRVDSRLWKDFTLQKPGGMTINTLLNQLIQNFVNSKHGLTEPKVSELETLVSQLLIRVKSIETEVEMDNLTEFPDNTIGHFPKNGTVEVLRADAVRADIEGAKDMTRLQLLQALQPKQMRWKEK